MKTESKVIIGLFVVAIVLQLSVYYTRWQQATLVATSTENVRDVDLTIDISSAMFRGSLTAKAALIEFSDYQCPFCAKFSNSLSRTIQTTFVDTGRIRMGFMDNPLPMHPQAKTLAIVAQCAGKSNLFWEVHDSLFVEKPDDDTGVRQFITSSGLNKLPGFDDCIKSLEISNQIDSSISIARDIGLQGTPSFVLGTIEGSKLHAKRILRGLQADKIFHDSILSLLGEKPEKPNAVNASAKNVQK